MSHSPTTESSPRPQFVGLLSHTLPARLAAALARRVRCGSQLSRRAGLSLSLLLGFPLVSYGQADDLANLASTPTRRAQYASPADSDDDDLVRNRGVGVRVGVGWLTARQAAAAGHWPRVLEAGAFFQRPFALHESVQIEALYFAQRRGVVAAQQGLRLPVLFVVNLFDNVGIHVGPQLQLARRIGTATPADSAAPKALTWAVVVGAEAHVGRVRVGARYGAPLASLQDLTKAGNDAAAAWHSGNIQVYLSAELLR